jgi:hypothetical protein
MGDPPPTAKFRNTTTTAAVGAEDENEPAFLDEERRGDHPLPTATRQKTTAAVEDEKEPTSTRAEERGGAAAAKDDRTVVDLLRSLSANIVANYIYPFAVKVIQNHVELIAAVDEYLDEYYSDDDGDEKTDDEDDIGNNRILYPIGDWDVSRVDDFTSVFGHMRNRKARHFNEDLYQQVGLRSLV